MTFQKTYSDEPKKDNYYKVSLNGTTLAAGINADSKTEAFDLFLKRVKENKPTWKTDDLTFDNLDIEEIDVSNIRVYN